MSVHGRSETLIPGRAARGVSPLGAHGRSEALIPGRAARRFLP